MTNIEECFSEHTRPYVKNLINFFEQSNEEQRLRFTYLFVYFSIVISWFTSVFLILSKGIEPQSRLAAVLVLISEQDGEIRVLLTTRGKDLKVHGGQTSLPGGKIDDEDKGDIISTAVSSSNLHILILHEQLLKYREANEEVNLPIPSESNSHIHTLGIMELQPFHKLVVVPVVALLTDNSILQHLKPSKGEVDRIFSHPVQAFLDPGMVSLSEMLVEKGSKDWPYPEDYHVCYATFHNA